MHQCGAGSFDASRPSHDQRSEPQFSWTQRAGAAVPGVAADRGRERSGWVHCRIRAVERERRVLNCKLSTCPTLPRIHHTQRVRASLPGCRECEIRMMASRRCYESILASWAAIDPGVQCTLGYIQTNVSNLTGARGTGRSGVVHCISQSNTARPRFAESRKINP